ncbi:hypothetical protein Tcan_03216 [Toxocara canis]|uniref:Uncharacterized protein n=1 Tax=Toxocara canis TaxID=6265 RepID=A0A0B2VVE4_TOXCA|nr:hypothetical protein Tcan_03216 [Toxocara canis]
MCEAVLPLDQVNQMQGALNAAGININRVISVSSALPTTEIPAANCVQTLGTSAFKQCTGGQTGNVAMCGENASGCSNFVVMGNFQAKINGQLTQQEKVMLQTGLYEMIFANDIFLNGAPTIQYE